MTDYDLTKRGVGNERKVGFNLNFVKSSLIPMFFVAFLGIA
jgi:hypothetical protein